MTRFFFFLIAILAGPVAAETARVFSGEHANFTRLVVEIPAASDWMIGRTAMGYGFTTAAPVQPEYDLSRVWDRIPKSRLQALRADPESGALLLTLACDCHVFPFEYQPGMIVLDLRNGPAPIGSLYETALVLPSAQPLRDQPPLARSAEYVWLSQPRRPPDVGATRYLRLPLGMESASLDPLRDELLLQLSRGAAEGVVDMVLPGKPLMPEVEGMGDLAGALIRIGELPGLEIYGSAVGGKVTGELCIPDEAIDISSWGVGRTPLDLLAEARAGLYEEFDTLSPAALRRSVQLHLYLGFGAEAWQYAALMVGADSDPQLAPLMSMARLIDGEFDSTSPFVSMLSCSGAAALWAALAHSVLPPAAEVDSNAIVRSFQALPPHLRRHLGPRLAALLRERDDEAARVIRNAVERTPDVSAGTVALIDAETELLASRPEAAIGHAITAVEEDGSGLAGLVALVEAHFESGRSLSPEVAESLQALRDVSDEDVARRERALILALALSGQIEAAFGLAGLGHADGADIWRATVLHAEDNAFLGRAVLSPLDSPPSLDPNVGLSIAKRLVDLGFPEAALVWLGPVEAIAAPERRLVAATALLALGNARGTLQLLSGLSSPEAQAAQRAAHQQLGAYDAARQVLLTAGNAEEDMQLASWEGDWDLLKAEGAPVWAKAAKLVDPVTIDADGPLAEGRAALDDSAAARAAIAALLAEVASP